MYKQNVLTDQPAGANPTEETKNARSARKPPPKKARPGTGRVGEGGDPREKKLMGGPRLLLTLNTRSSDAVPGGWPADSLHSRMIQYPRATKKAPISMRQAFADSGRGFTFLVTTGAYEVLAVGAAESFLWRCLQNIQAAEFRRPTNFADSL